VVPMRGETGCILSKGEHLPTSMQEYKPGRAFGQEIIVLVTKLDQLNVQEQFLQDTELPSRSNPR